MSKLFVVTDEDTTGDSVFLYDVSIDGAMTLLASNRIQPLGNSTTTTTLRGQISRDGRFAFVPHNEIDPGDFGFTAFDLRNNLALIAQAPGVDGMNSVSNVATSDDGSVIWSCHFSNWTGVRTFDGTSFGAYNRIREGEQAVDCTSDGRLCVAVGDGDSVLLENVNGSPVNVSSFSTFGTVRSGNISVSPDDQFVAIRSDSGSTGRLEVFELSDTGLTLIDHAPAPDDNAAVRPQWSADGTKLFLYDRWYSWDGSSLTEEATFVGDEYVARNTSGSLIAVRKLTAGGSIVIRNGETFAELSETSINATGIGWFEFIPEPVLTEQERFQFSYADVSGRDPLPTALGQRGPARNLADFYLSQYLHNPRIVEFPVAIDIEDLRLIEYGSMVWIEPDNRYPLFRMGRWAQVLGASQSGAEGAVTLEVRICDNPESFERT